MLTKILLFIFLISSLNSYAGSCCGGGGGTTKIMLGDTDKVFRLSYLDRTILADSTDSDEIKLRTGNELESIRVMNISTSIRFNEYWQYGLLLKAASKTKKVNQVNESYSGLGDTELNIAFEFKPEISRNSFISQGFLYSKLQLPTGKSLFTTKRSDTLDTVGTGHYLLSFGTIFTKRYRKGLTTATIGVGYRPARSFQDSKLSNSSIKTDDSFNYDLSLVQSFDFTNSISLELGASRSYYSNLATSIFSGVERSSALNSISLGGTYNTENYTLIVTYSDDFLIGSSYNNVLGRSIELGIIKKVNL